MKTECCGHFLKGCMDCPPPPGWVKLEDGTVVQAPAAPEPHIEGYPLYSGLPPAAPAAERPGKRLLWARKSDIEGLPEDGGTVYLTPGPRPFTDWVALAGPMPPIPAHSREPLTFEQKEAICKKAREDAEAGWPYGPNFVTLVIEGVERAHGIGGQP